MFQVDEHSFGLLNAPELLRIADVRLSLQSCRATLVQPLMEAMSSSQDFSSGGNCSALCHMAIMDGIQ